MVNHYSGLCEKVTEEIKENLSDTFHSAMTM